MTSRVTAPYKLSFFIIIIIIIIIITHSTTTMAVRWCDFLV